MWREIQAQPEVLGASLPKLRHALLDMKLRGSQVLAGGCGDSYYAAYALRGTFAELKISYLAATAQELSDYTHFEPGDVVVLVSISGGTRRTVEAARVASQAGATTVAVTCNAASDLADVCSHILVLPYTPLSRRTPHTLDYSVSLLALTLIAEHLSGHELGGLERLSTSFDEVLSVSQSLFTAVAQRVTPQTKFFFLGAGPDRGTAMYGAAKFYEAGGLVAFHEETENFVHGMNFLLEPDDIVVLITSSNPAQRRAEELASGLEALKVVPIEIGQNHLGSSHWLRLPNAPSELHPFLTCIGAQVLCYAVVETLELTLEEARAGRPNGLRHANVQNRWMKETRVK